MRSPRGILVISLDFELYWGMRDVISLEDYRANLLGVRQAAPAMLDLFAAYGVHATWATVGLLFFETREQLLAGLPDRRPAYADRRLSPYFDLDRIGADERDDPFHYAPSLIRQVAARPHQEIATHTFSHYYCLEQGQTIGDFRADLSAAAAAAARFDLRLESIVFPRNQVNADYLAACAEVGIIAYRGNPDHWLYRGRASAEETPVRRAVRLADAYLNLSSHNGHALSGLAGAPPVNVPASRFLRPYLSSLRALESLRLRRILDDLTHAARAGALYHLWWHPHNFGALPEQNLSFLKRLLDHYARLRETEGMESLTMAEVAARVRRSDHA
jgi:hypothetical protein